MLYAVFVIRCADGGESKRLIKTLQILLGTYAYRVARMLRFGAGNTLSEQLLAGARGACLGRRQYAAQRHFRVLGARRQAAQVGRQLALAIDHAPAQQMHGVLIVAIQVRVEALLFQHKHALAQGQYLVERVGAEFFEGEPLPVDHACSEKSAKEHHFKGAREKKPYCGAGSTVLMAIRWLAATDSSLCQVSSDDGQGDVDIAARGVRVRAHDVGGGDQRFGGGALHAWQRDFQFHFDAEAGFDGADADMAFDSQVGWHGDLVAATDEFDGADEAGRVAGGEQLFRVGADGAVAAQFFRRGQFHVQHIVGRDGAAFAATGGSCLGAVQDLFDRHDGFLWFI